MIAEFRAPDRPRASRFDRFYRIIDELRIPVEFRFDRGSEAPEVLRAGEVGPLRVVEWRVAASECRSTSANSRRGDMEFYQMQVVTSGQMLVEQDARQVRLEPGDFTFLDLSRPVRWSTARCDLVCLTIPRALLPLGHDEPARLVAVHGAGDRGTGALISALARQLPDHLDSYDADSGARLGTIMIELVSLALAEQLGRAGDGVPPRDRRYALLARIYTFIEQHLHDPELSPAAIAATHHISARYLYKLFESEPASVTSRIRERRLARCRQDLLDPTMSDRSVRVIATRWGFRNAAHFNRQFRAVYGVPPGEYRRLWRPAAPEPGAPEPGASEPGASEAGASEAGGPDAGAPGAGMP